MAFDEVKATTYDVGKRHGFIRKTNTMWLHQRDTVGVINLQRSNYGPVYYVNVCLWVRPLGDQARPHASQCPVRARIEDLVEEPASDCSAFNLELDWDPPARAAAISSSLAEAMDGLRACDLITGLLQPPGDRFLTRGWVHADVRRLLTPTQPDD